MCLGFFKSSWFSSHRFHSEKTYFSGRRLISFHPAVSASTSTREKQKKGKEATDGSERIEGSFFCLKVSFLCFSSLWAGKRFILLSSTTHDTGAKAWCPCHPFVPSIPGSHASTVTQISSKETQITISSHAEALTAHGIVEIYLPRCVPIKKATTKKRVTKIASF